ncbi:MAG TPA: TlpA disulfide reductase family protein [Isosphaeraceae bacterium]|nr:TlpA disulfide reductase family protein [Isosphaeraceae bacterium]
MRKAWTALLAVSALASPAWAQDRKGAGEFKSLEALHEDYSKRLVELDRRRIDDLGRLAARAEGDEAAAAYRELFSTAIGRELYDAAEPFARKALADASVGGETRVLAAFVALMAKADRGQLDESLEDLSNYVTENRAQGGKPLDENLTLTLGEAYLQRLIRGRRYDLARKLGRIASGSKSKLVRDHFAKRMAALALLGKPAPALSGTDADGKPVRLADFKGKVVLVDFWATWCPPCVAAIPELAALDAQFGKKGLVILGVNLDAQRQDVGTVAKARPIVRRFLVENRVTWRNLVAGPGGNDPARAFGVEEIPANFLIGRDGKVLGTELGGDELAKAVAEALGEKK